MTLPWTIATRVGTYEWRCTEAVIQPKGESSRGQANAPEGMTQFCLYAIYSPTGGEISLRTPYTTLMVKSGSEKRVPERGNDEVNANSY